MEVHFEKIHKSQIPVLLSAEYSMTSGKSKDVILENCLSFDIHIIIIETHILEKLFMKVLPTRLSENTCHSS